MIGSGLKKLAKENEMKVSHGVGYGSLRGFAATLSEGSNYKQIIFSTNFPDQEKKDAFMQLMNQTNIQREYRVQQMTMSPRTLSVVFLDTIGTMKKITAFLDWFLPLLEQGGATKYNVCVECGTEITAGKWVLVDGIAYYLHDSCAQRVLSEVDAENTQRKEEASGSYLTGTVGAILGALVGSVLWAVILYVGYVASIVGFVIGWLANKGYDLLKGKKGKGKVAILIVAVILGVIVGNFLPDLVEIASLINEGELPGVRLIDAPMLILAVMIDNPEYAAGVGGNILMGLLFAALGVYTVIRKAGQEVADLKAVVLE